VWNCNNLKFTGKSSPYCSYTAALHIGIIHEQSLFQCVTHTRHFNMGRNIFQ
jgi:hypothetical protein